MTPEEEFETLKKDYILKTAAHLQALENIIYDDLKSNIVKGEIAIAQHLSSTSFMALCKFILKFNANKS